MRPWFHSEERQAALWTEQQRWFGTPFFPHAESLGHGVDCVRLVHAILVNLGAIPRLELPRYTLDHAKHSTQSQLLRFLLTDPGIEGRFILVPLAGQRMAGDLLGVKSGRVDHHLTIVNPWGEVVHAIEDQGVVRTPLDDAKLSSRVLYVLRLMEATA